MKETGKKRMKEGRKADRGGKKWRKKEGEKLVEIYAIAYEAASNNLHLLGTYQSNAF